MMRRSNTDGGETKRVAGNPASGRWSLSDAGARLAELVRKARSEGPQRIDADGSGEVVVISSEDYRLLRDEPTGRLLVAAIGCIAIPRDRA